MRLLALLAAWAIAGAAAAQYPSKPLKLVVGYPPGGSGDFLTRLAADELAKDLGQPVIVENKPGAGGNIAHEFVARSAPDGYTILNATHMAINRALYKKLSYDPDKDFAPIGRIATGPTVICVLPNAPFKDLREMIAYARANPGKLFHASAGYGSAPHLASVLFESVAGIKFTHVQFKGGGPATQSLLAGDSRHPGRRGSRPAGLRLHLLVRSLRAGGHAARGDPARACGAQQGARQAGRARQDRAAGHGRDAVRHAGGVRRGGEEGNAVLGEPGARIGRQG